MKKIIREHKWSLLLSTLVILAPMVIGTILWNSFPETMAIHWGVKGNADGYGSRCFVVYGMPLLILAVQWLCVLATSLDARNARQSKLVTGLMLWIWPVISVFVDLVLYLSSWRVEFSEMLLVMLPIALIFIVIGNYMPKFQPNTTMGIRVPWVYTSDENWRRTHRLGGKTWMICGALMIIFLFLPTTIGITCLVLDILLACIIPIAYSYAFYRKQYAAGEIANLRSTMSKTKNFLSVVLTVLVLIFVCVMMFAGRIRYTFGEQSLRIDPTFYHGMEISYEGIDSIELRNAEITGSRTNGWGSAKLLMGEFKNEEFGYFTRYTYARAKENIILRKGSEVLVLSEATPEETEQLYQELSAHIKK